jgi:hypothetical protein
VTWTDDKEAEHQRIRADFAEEQVERLKQQLAEADARALVREAEVERLQAIIEANDNYDQDATEREVKRLQAELEKRCPKPIGHGAIPSDKIERLTKERDVALMQRDQKDAEVERLRALAKSYRRDWVTAEAEVERRIKQVEEIVERNNALVAEVERLTAENRQLRRRV